MAKLYYAKMHVAVGDYIARPGEVIEGEFGKLDIDRLLHMGAICECSAPVGVPHDEPTEPEGDPHDDQTEAETDADSATDETGDEEDSADTDDDDGESEDMEPAPASIDVMDGITPASVGSAAPKKTRKARGGKTE